jgi:5-methylcytosine-specific restriction protein A
VDHIRGKASGGSDEMANLQAICDDCHRSKTQAEAAASAQGNRR